MTYLIIVVLVVLSGLFSGLTLGLLSLNKTELERKINLGDARAKKVFPIRKKGNLLLCTLLLGNVAVNAALSIYLGNIATGLVAGIIATSLIVVFGEIVPQAIVSRYALTIGAKLIWLVKMFIIVFFPVAGPMAYVLDRLLGEEMSTIWSRAELREIIKLHEDSSKSDIDESEERIMLGALSFSKKKVENIMTPRTVVLAYDFNTVLDENVLREIKEYGFSRIPVYKEKIDNLVGILYTRDLIGVGTGGKIKNYYKKDNIITVSSGERINKLFDKFSKNKVHIAMVLDEFGGFEGVVTLEDVIEEIFRVEIMDESDKIEDLQLEAKKRARKFKLKNKFYEKEVGKTIETKIRKSEIKQE